MKDKVKKHQNRLVSEEKKKIIRRYMDYPKFLDFIIYKSLYFSSPYQFEDELDVFVPKYSGIYKEIEPITDKILLDMAKDLFLYAIKSNAEKFNGEIRDRDFYYRFTQNVLIEFYLLNNTLDKETYHQISSISLDISKLWYNKELDQIPNLIVPLMKKTTPLPSLNELNKNNVLISCWHSGDTEVDAMWKLYSKNDGILIETTIDKLEKKLDLKEYREKQCITVVDRVKYIDLVEENNKANNLCFLDKEAQSGDMFKHFFQKRKCFEFEDEIRYIIRNNFGNIKETQDLFPTKRGVKIKIKGNINDFIDKIVVSPYAPVYYVYTLKEILRKLKLHKLAEKVKISNISEDIHIIKKD